MTAHSIVRNKDELVRDENKFLISVSGNGIDVNRFADLGLAAERPGWVPTRSVGTRCVEIFFSTLLTSPSSRDIVVQSCYSTRVHEGFAELRITIKEIARELGLSH